MKLKLDLLIGEYVDGRWRLLNVGRASKSALIYELRATRSQPLPYLPAYNYLHNISVYLYVAINSIGVYIYMYVCASV